MDRSEAEAIYDAGRERCVEVVLGLAGSVMRLEERVAGLEEQCGLNVLESSLVARSRSASKASRRLAIPAVAPSSSAP
jgi:hypothetical protein